MAYNYPKVKMVKGLFGPTSTGHYYKPAPYHNKAAQKRDDKTKWILKQGEQYEVFRIGDEHYWYTNEPTGIFSILENGKEVFGDKGERIAFFPRTQNEKDPWHGYPVPSNSVPDEIAEKWLKESVIERIQYIRIIKGSL